MMYFEANVMEEFGEDTGVIHVVKQGILKLPFFVYPSVLFSHWREIRNQIKEFKPDIIVGFGILTTYLASRVAKKKNIPFIYYWINVIV